MAAKMLGSLPESRIPRESSVDLAVIKPPHALWLMTEAYLLQGKDPAPIHEASIKAMLGGNLFNL